MKHKIQSSLNKPWITLLVVCGLLWLGWYSQHAKASVNEANAFVEQQLASYRSPAMSNTNARKVIDLYAY